MEGDGSILEAMVGKFILDADGDVSLDVELVVVREAVDLVNENLNIDVGVCPLESEDGGIETHDGLEIVVLSIYDPDESSNLAKDSLHIEFGVLKDVDLAREVPNLEIHKGAIARS